MKKLKNLTTIVFQPNRLVTKWKFLSFSKLYLSPLPVLFQIFSCSFLACLFPAADDCDIDGGVRNIKLLLLLVCSLLTAGHQFLVANSHSSNSSSWSVSWLVCLSVGPQLWQHFHLVHYLNYLKLSLSNRLFILYLQYVSTFTFIQMYSMINES